MTQCIGHAFLTAAVFAARPVVHISFANHGVSIVDSSVDPADALLLISGNYRNLLKTWRTPRHVEPAQRAP